MTINKISEITLFIFSQACKRAESSKSCNLIGSESGRYFTILPTSPSRINLRSGSIFRFALKITFRRARRNENRAWYKPSTKRLPPTFLIDWHLPNQPTKTTSVACFFSMQIFHTWEKCNFPRFSVHKSLKFLENYIAHFFKGYINKPNEFSSAFNVADLVPCVHLQFANLLEKQTS